MLLLHTSKEVKTYRPDLTNDLFSYSFSAKGLAYQELLRLNEFEQETSRQEITRTPQGEIYFVDENGEPMIDPGPGPYLVSKHERDPVLVTEILPLS